MKFLPLLVSTILYCLCVIESVCGASDQEIYQDLLSGKRSLAAVGKVNDRVILVVQPTNGSIPLNDTYVFEATITNDDYTELVLQNGELIGEHWPNFQALTQPLMTAFFLRDQGNNHYLVVCQQDINDLDCKCIQVDGGGDKASSVIQLPKLKDLYATPTLLSDTGMAFNSFNLYVNGPQRVEVYGYTFKVDNSDGLLDESITWDKGHQPFFTLCTMNEAHDQVKVVATYAQDCTQLGWVVSNALFDEHHSTFFAKDGIYRMDRLVNQSIDQWNKVQKFSWQQFIRLGHSESGRGLSVGATVAIAVIVTFLATAALAVAIVFLCRLGPGLASFGGGGGSKSGKKAAANIPQKSNKMAKSKAASKK